MSNSTVLEAIRAFLSDAAIAFVEKEHAPTFTSQESAAARGEPLRIGAKALVMKTDDVFRLFVLPADRRANSAAIKRHLGVKKTRFAQADELLDLVGLVPGSVPPFGRPVLSLPLFADVALLDEPRMAFNAGSLTTSLVMATVDYQRVCGAEWFSFSQPPETADNL